MKHSFIFDAKVPLSDSGDCHVTAVHIGPAEITTAQLRADLIDYFDTHDHLPPERILLLGTAGILGWLQQLSCSEPILSSIPHFTRNSDPPSIFPLCIGQGGPISVERMEAKPFVDQSVVGQIRKQGIFSLFRAREPILDGRGFVHYAKPSQKHCEKFIRAANALVRGADVEFVAFCLLDHLLRLRPKHIYTDTAAIAMVAYAAIVQMRQIDPKYQIPAVDSFSSHKGVRNYHFENPEESLFFISASTSGELERVLIHLKGIPRKNIVTLFYLGEKCATSQILCDVSKRSDNPTGWIEIARSYPQDSCPLCDRGLRLIRIVGDQFLTPQLTVVPELITLRSKPRWLDHFLGDLVGLRVLSCHRFADVSEEKPRELFVDLARLYGMGLHRLHSSGKKLKHSSSGAMRFTGRLDRLLEQVVPASLSEIVYLRNSSSKALAQRVARIFRREVRSKKVRIVPSSTVFKRADGKATKLDGTVMVVAGAVVAGQQLMEISQALRYHRGAVSYFAGLMRTKDSSRLDEICSNLRQGGHVFNYAENIYLSDDSASRLSPWDREVATLRALLKRCHGIERFRTISQRRITLLETARASGGLQEDLFWPAAVGRPLHLRPGFALWSFDYSQRQHTQADVYFTLSGVLHSWRTAHLEEVASEHKQLMLAPRNFVRFDDGIIQAALLRGAVLGELDYRSSQEQSEIMGSVLEVIFKNVENRRGEACIEFLLAILEGRLRLVKKDVYGRIENVQLTLERLARQEASAEFGRQVCLAILDLLDKE